MTYITVFQVSDRLPEIPLGAFVLLLAALATALMVRHRESDTIPLIPAVLLVVGGIGCGLLLAHHSGTGDLTTPAFMTLWCGGWTYALWSQRIGNSSRSALLRTRLVWAFRLAPVLLLVVIGAQAVAQFPAFDLGHRLASGEGIVRSGAIEKIVGKPDSSGCFWLGGQEYCYGANGLGYSLTPGGPIASGDMVRITWIGDDIVKVEVLRPSP